MVITSRTCPGLARLESVNVDPGILPFFLHLYFLILLDEHLCALTHVHMHTLVSNFRYIYSNAYILPTHINPCTHTSLELGKSTLWRVTVS